MLYLLQKISKGIYRGYYEVNRMVVNKLLTRINCRFVNMICRRTTKYLNKPFDKHFGIL